ncbi:Pimeloyl-ACP methyl ester carboxylesterase [Amycolatopsis xylanica]|uniref:Pimeloyl-ACP methyl ester carboxylesterase n=1 Tax=Amycolatopsis xylanica TaxID=589385 RepID=A0A1H3HJF5_9PSEU|nr:alpha/beta hydrolase [Amycolatopsis xylanica]SDY15607.1 Pimeloyl-ACP methyl ester carboxylesterase [Amycolatopsis xylanica]
MPKTSVEITGGEALVHYDVTGSGPGLVLVHGTAATREQWLPLTDAARDRYTVVAPDYSGSGLTVDHGGVLTVEDLAAEVLAAADDAGLGEFRLAGHSLGAVVAAHLAGTHPDRVHSLVLHACWAVTDTRFDAELRYWLELLDTGAFARMLPLMAFGPRYWATATTESNEELVATLDDLIDPVGAARQIEVDRRVDLRDILPKITAPTLLLASEHDRIIDRAQQELLAAAIPDVRRAGLDAGHGAPAEDPAGFAAAVLSFMDE